MASLLFVLVFIGLPFAVGILIYRNKKKKELALIIESEKKRKEHPDIQDGKFTRLYTMPFCRKINGKDIAAYFKEQYPQYYSMGTDDFAEMSESFTGIGDEKRQIHITHLPEENITAIELFDPHEIEHDSKYTSHTRTSLNDKGFSEEVRKVIRHFQEQAVLHPDL